MNTSTYIKGLLVILVVMLTAFTIQSDDKELFMGSNMGAEKVRPNVMILMDNSGSMNSIVWYPKFGLDKLEGTADDGFFSLETYEGTLERLSFSSLTDSVWYTRWINNDSKRADVYEKSDLGNNWTGCYAGNGTPNNFQVGGNGASNFEVGDQVIWRNKINNSNEDGKNEAMATISGKYLVNGVTWFELDLVTMQGVTIVPDASNDKSYFQKAPDGKNVTPAIVHLYGYSDDGNPVRYDQNYLRWLFIHADEDLRRAVTHHSFYGTFDVSYIPPVELSNCATPGNNDLTKSGARIKKTFTRIQTAREVVCRVASTSNTIVRLGLFKFTLETGGELVQGLSDMSDESSELVSYKNTVWGIAATTWTPLAEALADIWYYFKPGPNSKTYWPVDYEIEKDTVNHPTSNPVSPIKYWCQNNYVVIMTDGESTMDDFGNSRYTGSIFNSKPVKRTYPWTSWSDGWGDADNNDIKSEGYIPANYNANTATYCPKWSCWLTADGRDGTDLLDDVSYFIRNQDMFPDSHFGTDPATGWPGTQNIFTYTIGFNVDNDMLLQTAVNGEGAYYTATNYDELVEAFQLVITGINLRNFAFSAITAPKKTATATNAEQTVSYVGYFLPSATAPIWEGHLLAFELEDSWGFDSDGSGEVESEEYVYADEEACLNAAGGAQCTRWVALAIGHEWDAADKIPLDRQLYTHSPGTTTNVAFTVANAADILKIIDPAVSPTLTPVETNTIINKIREPHFADVFHSDVGFVGPPPYGKQFIPNLSPTGSGDQSYDDYYTENNDRGRVIYAGTNDGIMHMLYADGVNAGKEVWGFMPDETLPSLRNIVLNNQHTYTVDGRMAAGDIWYTPSGGSTNQWATLMTFGLRRGGNAYYGMDITKVTNKPKMLWKFKDPVYSGQSWGKPSLGRVKIEGPGGSADIIDKWVVFVNGGFEFNSENPYDQDGKAIFMLDAATGDLLWMIGYDRTSGKDSSTDAGAVLTKIETQDDSNYKYSTKSEMFNFSFPTALTAIDRDNDGYTDTLFYGNVGGHLFKTDVSALKRSEWLTTVIYKREYIKDKVSSTISKIVDNVITVGTRNFELGDSIMMVGDASTPYAYGYITNVDNRDITVVTQKGTFLTGKTVKTRTYDPIYLSPAVAYDTCYTMWITFGTGDRDRPRSNLNGGRYVGLRDNNITNSIEDIGGNINSSTLQRIVLNNDILTETELTSANGWYFDFPDPGEKIFDPEPIILPDSDLIPHIYFNTFQPPAASSNQGNSDNPCDTPQEGVMIIYDVSLLSCGSTYVIGGERTTGRVAGGGIYQGKEYVLYKSSSGNVADVPGGEGGNFVAEPKKLPYSGGIVFWKEKKR